jgi:hypothetical protein
MGVTKNLTNNYKEDDLRSYFNPQVAISELLGEKIVVFMYLYG